MPTLKPLFSRLLDATGPGSSPNSSRRSFQKIKSSSAPERRPESHAPGGRSSIGGDYSGRTTGFRVSSQLELEVNRDYELGTGPLPDYLQHSGNSWACQPSLSSQHNPRAPMGGYEQIDDSFQPTSVPLDLAGIPPARIQS
ncbi:MAG: hypothetical protein Q9226_000707 [Calogaya cf. arnoldii]